MDCPLLSQIDELTAQIKNNLIKIQELIEENKRLDKEIQSLNKGFSACKAVLVRVLQERDSLAAQLEQIISSSK